MNVYGNSPKVKILEGTTKNPLEKIGYMAGVCVGADVSDSDKNIARAKECIKSGHGRVLEFVDIELVIDGYSARVIREWYTHIGGSPTRLQESTRYCKWGAKEIIIPDSVQAKLQMNEGRSREVFEGYKKAVSDLINEFTRLEVPKEDIAMFYPLGMETKIVDKRNLRNFTEMCHQRLCSRAYWEYRRLMSDIIGELMTVSEEWVWICRNLFVPKCEVTGFCTEKKSCGRVGKKSDLD